MGRTALLAVFAAGFGLASVLLLHVAGWIWLEKGEGALAASLWVALADALIVGILLYLARPRKDQVADEARLVRRQSLSMLAGTDAEARPYDWQRLVLQALSILMERWLKK